MQSCPICPPGQRAGLPAAPNIRELPSPAGNEADKKGRLCRPIFSNCKIKMMSPEEQTKFQFMLLAFVEAVGIAPNDLENTVRHMRALTTWIDGYAERELVKYVGKNAKLTVKDG